MILLVKIQTEGNAGHSGNPVPPENAYVIGKNAKNAANFSSSLRR
jgi:acetylornithine deacetylase/succinyl-diaminopimelate desuccinylase-like protein